MHKEYPIKRQNNQSVCGSLIIRIICAQGQRLNLFVLQTKKIQFLLSFAVLTDKKYVKKVESRTLTL